MKYGPAHKRLHIVFHGITTYQLLQNYTWIGGNY